jgi:GT2 family glycosyltransferase
MGIGLQLSISIVNTNNRDLLNNCLQTIYNTTLKTTFEVIVIDNASTDSSVDMVIKEFPGVVIICNDRREGYGFSHNRGIETAKGELVLIFNEDMIVLPGALDTMVETMQRDPVVGVLGCKLLNEDMSLQHSCFNFPSIAQEVFETFVPKNFILAQSKKRAKMYHWSHDEERDVDIVMGSCMLIPSRVLKEVGGFDTRFFVYSEEFDLCKRIKKAGYRVIFTPKAQIIHLGGQTSKSMSVKMYLIMMQSKIKYFNKHHGVFASTSVRALTGIGAAIRVVGWVIMWLINNDKRTTSRTMLSRYIAVLGLVIGIRKI